MAKRKCSAPILKYTQAPESNLVYFAKRRLSPQVGDLFVVNLCGSRWVAGRVIRVNCHKVFTDGVLIYFYRKEIPDPLSIQTPLLPDLAIGPILLAPNGFRIGIYLFLRNEPLISTELLPRHVFWQNGFPQKYKDEFDDVVPPPKLGQWCPEAGFADHGYLDDALSWAFGFPRKPDYLDRLKPTPRITMLRKKRAIFWGLLEQIRMEFNGSKTDFTDRLAAALTAEGPEGAALFNNGLQDHLAAGDTWWLRGAAHLLCGPCSEAEFLAFRAWLASLGEYDARHGRQYPEHIADVKDPPFVRGFKKPYQFAELLDVPAAVYAKLTGGKPLPPTDTSYSKEPLGIQWAADGPDLQRILPVLSEFVALRNKAAK